MSNVRSWLARWYATSRLGARSNSGCAAGFASWRKPSGSEDRVTKVRPRRLGALGVRARFWRFFDHNRAQNDQTRPGWRSTVTLSPSRPRFGYGPATPCRGGRLVCRCSPVGPPSCSMAAPVPLGRWRVARPDAQPIDGAGPWQVVRPRPPGRPRVGASRQAGQRGEWYAPPTTPSRLTPLRP